MRKKLIQKVVPVFLFFMMTIGIFQINATAAEPITEANITVELPYDGDGIFDIDSPSASNGISVGEFDWHFNGSQMTLFDDFEFGNTYVLKLRLYCSPNAFGEEIAVTVNGQPATVLEYGTTSLLISFEHTVPVKPKYTITFDSMGGSPVDPMELTLGSTLSSLEEPEKENAIFLGWYTDIDTTERLSDDTCIFDHMTLYAKWSHSFHITVTNGENTSNNDDLEILAYLADFGVISLDLNTQQVFNQQGKLLFTINNEGNIVFGEGISSEDNFLYVLTEDEKEQIDHLFYEISVSFVPENKPIYTIIFDSKGGSPVEAQFIKKNQTINVTETPTKEGFMFTGWFTDSDLKNQFNTTAPINSDMTLYARWSKIITTPIRDGLNMESLSEEQTDILFYLTYKGLIQLDPNSYEVYNADGSKLLFQADPNTGSIMLGENVSSEDNIEYYLTAAEMEESDYYVAGIRLTFTATIQKISTCTLTLSKTSYTYDGTVKAPTVTVTNAKGTKLTKDIDYTVSYESGRKNAGTYKVTVTMKGNYTGTKTLSFKINPIDISKCNISLSSTSYTYNGKAKKPTVTVKNASGTKLTKDTHYTVSYASGRTNAGTYKVTVTMKGNYTGTKTLSFKINPINVSKCNISLSSTSYTYNGKAKKPTVTVKNASGTKLTKDTHYTVSYTSGRTKVGKYKVTVKMKGNYTGTKTLTFKINPEKTTISKLTPGKKSLTVNITKKSTQVTGYQIQYATSKNFTNVKTKTISSYKTTKTVLSNLSAGKTYYVRVRTYKTVDGTKFYSDWSSAKSAKTK